MAREQMQIGKLASQWSMRLGVLMALTVVLTACGAQPESAPVTTEPAATTAAPTSAPATTAADEDDDEAATAVAEDEGVASPVAAATPVGMVAATPVGAGELMASPVAGAAEATPVRRNRDNKATPVGEVALSADECAVYLAWKEQPDVQAALAYVADWPQILAEGDKLAAGESIDTAAMQALADELDGQANVLRDSGSEELGHDAVAFPSKAMGLASRMARGLADGTLTQAEAGAAVVDLRAAIDRFELDAVARDAACG